jgi:phthalate 4,5-cis-dihydrodiol dehydrogenase
MPDKLRLGFAGLGMAGGRTIPEIARLPHVKLTAAADLRKESLDKFKAEFNAEVYFSVEEMCQSPNVDAVYIATPHEFHAPHTLVALQNRKHVIVEKPMALSIEECEKMNAAAEKFGVKLMCAHTKIFSPPLREMRKVIKSGELGKLLMIQTSYHKDFMYREWTDHDVKTTHGVILNQGPHQVDIVRYLGGGMVRSVRAMTKIVDEQRPAEGHYACYLEFEDGVPASLIFSGYAFLDTAEIVWGIGEGGEAKHPDWNPETRRAFKEIANSPEKERLLEKRHEYFRYGGSTTGVNPYQITRNTNGSRHQAFFGLTIVTCEKGEMRQSPNGIFIYGEDGKREIKLPREPGGARGGELGEFYDAIMNDRPVFHDGKWGTGTLEVCFAILKSAEERREVYMSHQVPVID